jgi:nuclear pore complex protein Nup160
MSSNLLDILSVDSFNNGLAKYFQHILAVFEQARSFSHVADFASLALQALESESQKAVNGPENASLRTDLLSRLFHASLKTSKFDHAYSALCRYTDLALQKSALSSLIASIFTACGPGSAGIQQLLRFPLSLTPHLLSYVDETLVALAKKQPFSSPLDPTNRWTDENNAPDYHRILHAYRIARNDFRGAAEVGYQTIRRLRKERDSPAHLALRKRKNSDDSTHKIAEDDPESKEIRHELLALINLLACVSNGEEYILVEEEAPSASEPESGRRRSLQTDSDEAMFTDTSPVSTSTTQRRPSSVAGSVVSGGRRDSRSISLGSSSGANVTSSTQSKLRRRIVVTLDHLRREYQAELDRVSRIERGDWEFGAIDDPEVDGDRDGDVTMVF